MEHAVACDIAQRPFVAAGFTSKRSAAPPNAPSTRPPHTATSSKATKLSLHRAEAMIHITAVELVLHQLATGDTPFR